MADAVSCIVDKSAVDENATVATLTSTSPSNKTEKNVISTTKQCTLTILQMFQEKPAK